MPFTHISLAFSSAGRTDYGTCIGRVATLHAVSPYIRDHGCILFEAREERQLGSLRRRRIILRLADALIATDSGLVIRVENMVTRDLHVDLRAVYGRGFRSGPERCYE